MIPRADLQPNNSARLPRWLFARNQRTRPKTCVAAIRARDTAGCRATIAAQRSQIESPAVRPARLSRLAHHIPKRVTLKSP